MRENGKLCILRLSAIGDVCHAVALVERIQRTRPDIQITWVIGKIEYQLVQDMPNIHFVIFDKKQGNKALKALKVSLNRTRFDVLFSMQVALRANIASLYIKAKDKIGFDSVRAKELHRLFINKTIAAQHHPHVLDGFMAFADAAKIPDGGPPAWHIPIPSDAVDFAQALQKTLRTYVVICPSASKAERNWTLAGYQTLASHLQAKSIAVVLCGGPSEQERHFADAIASQGNIAKNLVGKTSLKALLAVLSRATCVVAPDTGPAHMATTVGVPVVGLYAHSNPLRTGPYNSQEHVVSVYDEVIQAQKGKPWQTLRWGTRAKGEELMLRIEPEKVCAQVDKIIEMATW